MRLNRERFPLVVEGLPFILPPAVVMLIAAVWGNGYLFFPCLLLTLCLVWFFRNPPREITEGVGLVLSPADGRVVAIKRGKGGVKVSIFMSVLNCHVNRAPAAGTITEVRYRRGRFLPADRGEASRLNEQNSLQVLSEDGVRMRLVQVAGILARRIICYVERGDRVKRGEIFGTILFGSRVDIYLPRDVAVQVKVGDRVWAGKSVLGVIE